MKHYPTISIFILMVLTTLLVSSKAFTKPGGQTPKEAETLEEVSETICNIGTLNVLLASKDATVLALEQKGLNVRTGLNHHCVGTVSIIAGKRTGGGFCKDVNPDGEITITEWTVGDKAGTGTWKYLYGSGALQGIKGEGTYERTTNSKPIAKGEYQSCNKATGTREVPK